MNPVFRGFGGVMCSVNRLLNNAIRALFILPIWYLYRYIKTCGRYQGAQGDEKTERESK